MGLINPTLPTGGQPRGSEEVDVINALTALLNLVNGDLDSANIEDGTLTATDLAADVLSNWRTLFEGPSISPGVNSFAEKSIWTGGSTISPNAHIAARYFDPADHAITGKIIKLRMRAWALASSAAPSILTIRFRPITTFDVSGNPSAWGATLGTVTHNLTAANGQSPQNVTAEFTAPAAGFYDVTAELSASVASLKIGALIQMRHV